MNEQASNVTTLAYQKQSAPAVSTGLFLTPSNLAEAMQIAKILADSDFVPKDYQRKPGNILVALQWGAEIGLQPLQALQNIACINGRPAIWGDAMLALVRQSGLLESIHEQQTDTIATCIIKRKGEQERTVTFSMDDAKRAGLAGKSGPWTQYPRRMMQSRARAYALRDIFPDVLKGMAVAEEEQDKLVNVTPTPAASKTSSVRDKVAARKAQVIDQPAPAPMHESDIPALEKAVSAIESAKTVDELVASAKGFADLGLSEAEQKQVNVAYKARKAALTPPPAEPVEPAEPAAQPEQQPSQAELDEWSRQYNEA